MRDLRCPTIVGRREELDALSAVLDAAVRGRGRAVFLVGEAGVGKSRVAAAAAEAARSRGIEVFIGRAVRSGLATPYRALSEAVLGALRLRALPETRQLAPFRRALGVLVPEWRVGPEPVEESLVVVGEAVLRLLRALAADRPSVLVLEDLHWADSETLGVLEYLVDNVGAEPLVVLVTLRDEPAPALALAHQLRTRAPADVITLGCLDRSQVSTMATSCLGSPAPPDVVQMLSERADGLPFFVEELLAALVVTGALVRSERAWETTAELCPHVPFTFADTVRHRLELVGDGARQVLGAAAIVGRQFDWELVRTVAAMGPDVLDVLRLAVEHRLLEEEATGGFRFRHALTREAILAQLLAAERVQLAERALAVLEDRRPGLPGDTVGLAASLAEQAGQHDRASGLHREVARRALAAGALQSAAMAARRAVQLATDDELTVTADEVLLQALALAGDEAGVEEVGERVLAGLSRIGASASRVAAAQLLLARCAVGAGEWSRARRFLEAARRGVDEPDVACRAQIEAQLAIVSLGENAIDEARTGGQRALAMARTAQCPDVVCEALEVLGRCARTTDIAHAETAFTEALAVANEAGLALWRVRALHELGTIDVMQIGETDRLVEARRAAEAVGALATAAHVDFHLGALHLQRCEFDAAADALGRAEDAARRFRLVALLPTTLTLQAAVCGFRGDLVGARWLGQAARDAAPGEDPEIEARVRWALAAAHLSRDEIRSAASECHAALEVLPPGSGFSQTFLPALGVLLRVLEDRSAVLPEEAVGGPAHLSPGLHAVTRAVVLGRQGHPKEAEAAFGRGDELLTPGTWLRHVVRRLVAERALEDGWGDPVPWLRESSAFFASRGIEPLARACRSLLRRAGAPLPRARSRTQHSVPDALRAKAITRREADVLALLAEGLANKEIGERLYLSPRTVEKHVERLLAKTETANRTQLTAFAVRLLD